MLLPQSAHSTAKPSANAATMMARRRKPSGKPKHVRFAANRRL
jgi:hypothetical protein